MNEYIETINECFMEDALPKSISSIKKPIAKGSLVCFTNFQNNIWYPEYKDSITTYYVKDLEYLETVLDKRSQYFVITSFGYLEHDNMSEKTGLFKFKDITEHGIAVGYVNTFNEVVGYMSSEQLFASIVVLFGDGLHIVPANMMKTVNS
jgi:hypothetical protein